MSFANRMTGKDLHVEFVDSSGTVLLSGDHTAFTPEGEQESADLTAGNDTRRGYKPTLRNWKGTLEVMYTGTAGTATMARVEEGDQGTLVWGPMGTAAGKPKWAIPVFVSRVGYSFPFDNAAKVTIEFMPMGEYVSNGNTDTF